jgi:hypothetical protein
LEEREDASIRLLYKARAALRLETGHAFITIWSVIHWPWLFSRLKNASFVFRFSPERALVGWEC